jgi:hypothetical protein
MFYTIARMNPHGTQSFFTPDVFLCQKNQITAKVYNLAQVLLKRSCGSHLFIPIRSLQYLALIEKSVFWFVDSFSYAVNNKEGGRLIRISWHPKMHDSDVSSLTEPLDCRVIFYGEDMQKTHNRLSHEFYQAMKIIDQRHRDSIASKGIVKILPFKSNQTP